jgi:hypothetical protein
MNKNDLILEATADTTDDEVDQFVTFHCGEDYNERYHVSKVTVSPDRKSIMVVATFTETV